MIILRLAVQSLWHRRVIMGLSLVSIALSVALLVGVERIRGGVRESFSGTISQTDLIVGAPTGQLQLLLYAVFNIGGGIGRVSYDSFSYYESHDEVEWAIPFSFGDSFRDARVVGTTPAFFQHYRHHGDKTVAFAQGRPFERLLEVVVGSEVARKHGLGLGQSIVLSHGLASDGSAAVAGYSHENLRFEIVGVLSATATPIDRAVYVSLESVEALHEGWEDGAPPPPGEDLLQQDVSEMELDPIFISGFYVKAKSRLAVLALQREIGDTPDESLMAIIPGVALSELWRNFAFFEKALLLIGFFVLGVALVSMFVGIYSSLQIRRREISILRSLGAGFSQVVALFVIEAWFVCLAAAVIGLASVYALLFLGQGVLVDRFGLYITPTAPGMLEGLALIVLIVLGSTVGFIPALKAYRTALSDGLAVKL